MKNFCVGGGLFEFSVVGVDQNEFKLDISLG